MVDGVAIYDYLVDDNSRKFLICRDALASSSLVRFTRAEDIHGDAKYIPIEFAGAATSLLFYVSYNKAITLMPCISRSWLPFPNC